MRDFNRPVEEKDFSLMAKGSLAFAIINVRGIKSGQSGPYLDLELTIDEGHPYQRRKIWKNLSDPDNPGLSPEGVNMSIAAIKHILEVGRGAHPETNAAGYQLPDGTDGLTQINGLRCAIQIGVESDPGYAAKNVVQAFLSPLSGAKSTRENYEKLIAGDFNINAAPAAAPTSGAGGFAAAAPAGTAPQAAPASAPNGAGSFAAAAVPGGTPSVGGTPPAQSDLDDEIPF